MIENRAAVVRKRPSWQNSGFCHAGVATSVGSPTGIGYCMETDLPAFSLAKTLGVLPGSDWFPSSAREPACLLSMAATLAAPFSGSTLLACLLARHSQLSSDGEIFPLEATNSVICSCGKKQLECPYYRQAAGHMLGPDGKSWDEALFAPCPAYSRFTLIDKALGRLWGNSALRLAQRCLRRIPLWRRRDEAFVAAHLRFMQNSLRLRRARVYVDGSKSVRRARLFARSGGVHLKVIQVVRDGRAFCFSYLKNHELPRTHLPAATRAWLKNLKAVERFHALFPHVPVLNVRYEDLCRDLPETMHRVCQFLAVPYEPTREYSDARPCHVLGNRMRLTFSGQIQENLRWQAEFPPEDIAFLNRTLRPHLERYQYSL